jgi:hypothetical protein
LYEYIGASLGCSAYGKTDFPTYGGNTNMYEVHKFMDLDVYQFGYFVAQVGASAASFGVAEADIEVVATALNTLFGYRCSPPTAVLPGQTPQPESICIADDCPIAPKADCSIYAPVMEPKTVSMMASATMSASTSCPPTATASGTAMGYPMANATMGGAKPSGTGSMTGSSSVPYTGGASAVSVGFFGAVSFIVLAFAL